MTLSALYLFQHKLQNIRIMPVGVRISRTQM